MNAFRTMLLLIVYAVMIFTIFNNEDPTNTFYILIGTTAIYIYEILIDILEKGETK